MIDNKKNSLKSKLCIIFLLIPGFIYITYNFTFNIIKLQIVGERTIGKIENIKVINKECRSNSKYSLNKTYDCTDFNAIIGFKAINTNIESSFEQNLSTSRSKNGSIDDLFISVGDEVNVIYDPNDISKAYINEFIYVFPFPFVSISLLLLIIIFIGIINEKEQKKPENE